MKAFFVTAILIQACNNNDTNSSKRERTNYREADDYNREEEYNVSPDTKDNHEFTAEEPTARWSTPDIDAFEQKCLETLNGNRETAFVVCPCLLNKMQIRYGSLREMDEMSTSAEGEKMAKECMEGMPQPPAQNLDPENQQNAGDDSEYSTRGKWSSMEVKKFVDECVGAAEKGGMEYLDAQSYCDCMQYKIERIYPRASDADRITKADLSTPEMKKMIRSCLPGKQ